MNVNETLVGQGLAPVLREDCAFLSADSVVERLANRLQAAESKARRKQLGMWKDDTRESREEKPSAVRRVFRWLGTKLKHIVWKRKKS